ncbi:MAG: hypothetical protein IK071_05845 [Lachnospiraceae bacterium]|nr:hypothetical protein [Lachnospiraceae bacterium]
MKNKSLVLLKTLLRSTSQHNIYKYSKDKKKKGRIIGNTIGFTFLYLLLMAYCVGVCIGYGELGIIDLMPAICSLTITALALFFTFFKTNGYLFNFKEYDMLMSLPFKPATVAGCKFIYMYVKSLPWNMSISVAILIGYAIKTQPAIWVYPVWIIMSLFLPIIPMLIASFLGFIIARISAGFRKKNIIQTVLTIIFVLAIFALRFVIEALARDSEKLNDTLMSAAETIRKIEKIYLPAEWFNGAVTCFAISDILLLIGVSVLLFVAVFVPVGRSYRSINSKLKSHAASKKFKMSSQKSRSVLNAIAFKEFKRMTGSSVYMTNVAMGEIFAVIIGIAVLFINIDSLIAMALQGAPVTKEILYPAFPMIIYFFPGMVATTAISPSLEGKNYWIVQSLPITKKTLCKGKMLFNMYLTVPFGIFATICLCISAKVPVLTSILMLVLIVCMCAFSTAWGGVCGFKYMRLDWENEIEVVKQGMNVTVYLLPNMFGTMAVAALMIFLGTMIDVNLILGILILLYGGLGALCYRKAISYT